MRAKRVIPALLCAAVLATSAIPRAEEGQERREIKPVLLVIDVQNQWMPVMAEKDRATAPDNINKAIALFREFSQPVIRVYHSDPKRGPEPGSEAFEFPDSIAVSDADAKVVKAHPSSFAGTDLEEILREGDRNAVFLCGLSATGCVLATYFGALERDFTVLMVRGAVLSHNAEYTEMIQNICYSVTLEELRDALEAPYFD